MRQTRAQYPGATLGGQAGHYPTPAVKGMSQGVVRKNTQTVMWVIADSRETVATLLIAGQQAHSKKPRAKEENKLLVLEQIAALKLHAFNF